MHPIPQLTFVVTKLMRGSPASPCSGVWWQDFCMATPPKRRGSTWFLSQTIRVSWGYEDVVRFWTPRWTKDPKSQVVKDIMWFIGWVTSPPPKFDSLASSGKFPRMASTTWQNLATRGFGSGKQGARQHYIPLVRGQFVPNSFTIFSGELIEYTTTKTRLKLETPLLQRNFVGSIRLISYVYFFVADSPGCTLWRCPWHCTAVRVLYGIWVARSHRVELSVAFLLLWCPTISRLRGS